jgi:hypothetical protein
MSMSQCDEKTNRTYTRIVLKLTGRNLLVLIVGPSILYYRCEMSNRCVKELVDFIMCSKLYPDMFRQVAAIFRGS